MKPAVLRSTWVPLLLAVLWLAATTWARPLMVPDEGRYAGVAWSMLTSGDWLVPRLNGLPYFHKPPLFYWITAGSLALFGPHEAAARVASLLGGACGATALYLFARRWFGEREARLGLVALATQPLFFIGAQFANLDMLVAGCIGVTILAFAHAALVQAQGERAHGALRVGYLFLALGVLAKGLIGVVLPALVLVPWLLLRRQPRLLLRLVWPPGIALFLAVAAPWFIAMQLRFPEFAHYFFVVQHFARYVEGSFNNQRPLWFIPAVLALLALPWSAWLAAAARRSALADPARGSLRHLLWLWLVVMVVFFSLPQSKLVGYILPATLPLALLAADSLVRSANARRAFMLWRVCAIGAVVACVTAIVAATLRPSDSTLPLARALQARMQPGDSVVFLQGYYFDVPFNARLRNPVVVIDDWDDLRLAGRDNWHKELADAGRFDPAPARRLLLTPRELPEVNCQPAAIWLIGGAQLHGRYKLLQGAERVAVKGGRALWQVPGLPAGLSRPGCPETPMRSSADR